jgi:hypothetical protein
VTSYLQTAEATYHMTARGKDKSKEKEKETPV